MEHELKFVKNEGTTKEGKKYCYVTLVLDNFMVIRFDQTKDNYWNLVKLLQNGEKIKIVGNN